MEIPSLPTPADEYGYLIKLLAGLLSLGAVVLIIGVRGYLKYRDKREADDKQYRDDQITRQEQHWQTESRARDEFRLAFEKRQNERFDKIESDIEAFVRDADAEIESVKATNSKLQQDLDRLKWELETKHPPKEGGK